LTSDILKASEVALRPVWELAERYSTSKTGFSLSYILSYPGITTVIPGLRTKEQVKQNVEYLVRISDEDRSFIENHFAEEMSSVMKLMKDAG
jgi:aryl-alcohol dehydrogenase-like predicted oxidoreductase